jgi:GNAT superfamily N-acetyltransferase
LVRESWQGILWGAYVSQRPAEAIAITPAEKGEEGVASAIVQEAASWLAASGRAMWGPEDCTPEALRPAIEAGELYLARVGGEPVGTMILQWEDPLYWPDVPAGESAFVHRLAVKRSMAGKGIAHALLEWAKRTARQAGRKYLRLDCDPERQRLCAFYESVGFARHSVRPIEGYVVARYQMALDISP